MNPIINIQAEIIHKPNIKAIRDETSVKIQLMQERQARLDHKC